MPIDDMIQIMCQTDDPVLDTTALAWMDEKAALVGSEGAVLETWDSLSNAGKSRAWYAKGLSGAQIRTMQVGVMQTLYEGRGVNEFLGRLESAGLAVTGAETPGAGQLANWHARLVWSMNVSSGQHAAQWQRLQEGKAERPYGEWSCGPQVCEICEPLCGVVAPLDGPMFSGYYPPLHLNCECVINSVSPSEVDAEGITIEEDAPDVPLVDPDWVYNRGDAYYMDSRGQTPATEVGERDAVILNTQMREAVPKPT